MQASKQGSKQVGKQAHKLGWIPGSQGLLGDMLGSNSNLLRFAALDSGVPAGQILGWFLKGPMLVSKAWKTVSKNTHRWFRKTVSEKTGLVSERSFSQARWVGAGREPETSLTTPP